jgi:hypothetical protein
MYVQGRGLTLCVNLMPNGNEICRSAQLCVKFVLAAVNSIAGISALRFSEKLQNDDRFIPNYDYFLVRCDKLVM